MPMRSLRTRQRFRPEAFASGAQTSKPSCRISRWACPSTSTDMQFIDSIANGGKWVWGTLLAFALAAAGSATLLNTTAVLRYERDVNRMVFNDNLGVLEEVKGRLGSMSDSLAKLASDNPASTPDKPYIVVSIADHQLWFKQGNQVLFNAGVATGSGKTLVAGSGGR